MNQFLMIMAILERGALSLLETNSLPELNKMYSIGR